MIQKQNSSRFILLLAATLSALAALTTDLYLPVFAISFNTNPSNVQLSLACLQLPFAPMSDKYERKEPLMMSLLAFFLGYC